MKNEHVTHLINEYIDGELDGDKLRAVESHLSTCPSCRREAGELRKLVAGLRDLPREIDPPADLADGFAGLSGVPGGSADRQEEFASRKNGLPEANEFKTPVRRGMSFLRPVFIYRAAAVVAVIVCAGLAWKIFGPSEPDLGNETTPPTVSRNMDLPAAPGGNAGANEPAVETSGPTPAAADLAKDRKSPKSDSAESAALMTGQGVPVTAERGTPDASVNVSPAAAKPRREETSATAVQRAGTGKIVGTVITRSEGRKISGAYVLLVGTTRGGVTDSSGRYSVVGVPTGVYTMRVSCVGYETAEAAGVPVDSGGSTMLDFQLVNVRVPVAHTEISADQQLANSAVSSETKKTEKDAGVSVQNRGVELSAVPAPAGAAPGDARILSAPNDSRGGRGWLLQTYRDREDDDFVRGTESYDRITENGFHDAFRQPKSTFSIDVDAASYANVRRFIGRSSRPPRDAVRIEEMVNYFTYDYPRPERGRPFSVTTEVAECPWNDENLIMLVGIQGKKVAVEDLPPGNLVFLIDVSGSMQSPDKLPLLKSAFRLLVEQLREEDRVSIVVYAGRAGLVLPPTSGYDKRRILDAIDGLEAGGSTAGGAGIRLAYDQARESYVEGGNNRVILATDGDFNVGVSSDDEMVRLIERERGDGIFLSVLGFGTGNLKDSKMEKLADKGNGNYSYVDNIREAKKVFVGQLAGTIYTIAKDVKIQVEFNPDLVSSYRLIGYENRVMRNRDFRDDRKDAGELGAGHTVTALYEVVPARGNDAGSDGGFRRRGNRSQDRGRGDLATVYLRYKDPDATRAREIRHPVDADHSGISRASENLRFAAAVAEFGMLLRDSEFSGSSSYRQVLRLAEGALGRDPEGYRAEFVRMVESAAAMFERD